MPPWKQAILDRRKKQEEEQKRKQAEEEAYLASIPPWKRALIQKREKEKQLRQQQEKETEETVTRSNSFIKRQQQLAQEREANQRRARAVAAEAKTTSTVQSGWGRRATPPGPKATTPPSSPTSPTSGYSHVFGGLPTQQSAAVHSTVTALPSGTDNPIAKKIANAPIPSTVPSQSRSSTTQPQKVVSSVKKTYEDKAQSQEIPAWKKALLQRRKEKEMKSEAPANASSLALDRKESPQELEPTDGGSSVKHDQKVESRPVRAPHSSIPVNRKPSPDETSGSTQGPGLALGRRTSPVEKRGTEKPVTSVVEKEAAPSQPKQPALALGRRGSPLEKRHEEKVPVEKVAAPTQPKQAALALGRRGSPLERQSPEPPVGSVIGNTVASSQPKTAEPNPLAIGRKSSPMESAGTDRGSSKLFSFERKHSAESMEGVTSISSTRRPRESKESGDTDKSSAPAAAEQGRPVSPHGRPTPKRAAPPPPSGSKKQQQSAQPKQQGTVTAQRGPPPTKPAPEIVNRGEPEISGHAQLIQKEGVTQRAPVYKEIDEWASVSEDDSKFRSLPLWKQALIKRRRADYAKRMGLTTCIDDVPQSNGPVTKNDLMHGTPWSPRNNLTEDTNVNIPLWKQEMMKRVKNDGRQNAPKAMSSHEKSQLAKKPTPVKTDVKTAPGNVKELLNRFSDRSSASSPPAVTSPTPRTPSPTGRTSSRPAHTATGVPPVSSSSPSSSSSSHTKTFTWSLGDNAMSDEALSDDSSGSEDEAMVTNIDNISSEEDDDDSGISGKQGTVVLLHPPRALSEDSAKTVSSILVKPNSRTKKVSLLSVYLNLSLLCLPLPSPPFPLSFCPFPLLPFLPSSFLLSSFFLSLSPSFA